MKTESKFFLTAFGGIIAGVCVALLLAPDKGSKTRKKLVKFSKGLKTRITSLLDFRSGHGQKVTRRKSPSVSRAVARKPVRTGKLPPR